MSEESGLGKKKKESGLGYPPQGHFQRTQSWPPRLQLRESPGNPQNHERGCSIVLHVLSLGVLVTQQSITRTRALPGSTQ